MCPDHSRPAPAAPHGAFQSIRRWPPRARTRSACGRAASARSLVAAATCSLVAAALGVLPIPQAFADAEARLPDDSSQAPASAPGKNFKLTFGRYHYSDSPAADDLNLRFRSGALSGWIGFYHDPAWGQQWRAGVERAFALLDDVPLSLQVSVQGASRGFFGGSLTLEYGEPWFVLAGVGRTNNRPYFNLNFDPNDAVSLGAGWRGAGGLTAYVLAVRDNRNTPGQQNLHLAVRLPLPQRQRLTVDLMTKRDPTLSSETAGRGLSVTYDWRDWSLRLADDRRQNFTGTNALRLSVAYRF